MQDVVLGSFKLSSKWQKTLSDTSALYPHLELYPLPQRGILQHSVRVERPLVPLEYDNNPMRWSKRQITEETQGAWRK